MRSLADMLGISADEAASAIEKASNRSCGLPGHVNVPDDTTLEDEDWKQIARRKHIEVYQGRSLRGRRNARLRRRRNKNMAF